MDRQLLIDELTGLYTKKELMVTIEKLINRKR